MGLARFARHTPEGRALATCLMAWSEFERDLIGMRISAALESKRQRGERLGAQRRVPADVERRIRHMRGRKLTYRAIADRLTLDGVPTPTGRRPGWSHATVAAILNRP